MARGLAILRSHRTMRPQYPSEIQSINHPSHPRSLATEKTIPLLVPNWICI